MRRVLQISLTIAVATVMIGIAATQARADRVAFNGGCFGVACAQGTLTIGGIPLSFTDSSFAADANLSLPAELRQEASGSRGGDFSIAPVDLNTAKTERTNKGQTNRAPDAFLTDGMMLWSSGTRLTVDATSVRVADFRPQVSATQSVNFSVVPAKSGTAQGGASIESIRSRPGLTTEPVRNTVGGAVAAVPEPTTMLLLGTGLLGTAAVLRRRRKVRGSRSK